MYFHNHHVDAMYDLCVRCPDPYVRSPQTDHSLRLCTCNLRRLLERRPHTSYAHIHARAHHSPPLALLSSALFVAAAGRWSKPQPATSAHAPASCASGPLGALRT